MNALDEVFGWLVERSWQATLLAVLIVLVRWAFGAALPAKWQYRVWFVLLGLLLLPSLPQSALSIYNVLPKMRAPANPVGPLIALPIKQDIPSDTISPPPGDVLSAPKTNAAIESLSGIGWWMAITWAIVAGGLLAFLFAVNIRFAWRLRRTAEAKDAGLQRVFRACKEELGVRRRVLLIETPAVSSPAVMGIFYPRLLVPSGFARSLEPGEIRFVFLHELGHLVRGDVRVSALLAVVEALHWFNPFLWWAFRQMRADRELACDAWVLSRVDAREGGGYGETLLKLTQRFQPERHAAGVVGILENHRALKTRIERIARFSARPRAWSLVGAAIVVGLSVLFLTGAMTPNSTPSSADGTPMPDDPSIGRICDRNGVVLVEYREDLEGGVARNRPSKFPLGAFAAQLLNSLDESIQPKPGETIRLTIDARMQMIVEEELRRVGRGAAVVLDPNTGDILAMASVPSFDPGELYPAIAAQDWKKLAEDKTSPLVNRALNAYTPGSVFIPVTALAGATMGLESKQYACNGGVEVGNMLFKCWIYGEGNGHGTLSLPEAMKVSCGSYFYQYGMAVGEQIPVMARKLGIGQSSGIPVRGESTGTIDSPERLQKSNPRDSWSDGLSANQAIGQGATLATPLQIAGTMEAVGNGGTLYWPRLVKSVHRAGDRTLEQPEACVRVDLLTEGVTRSGLELVRGGLWKTVNEDGGNARKAATSGLEIAGKTGTAQVWRIEGDQKTSENLAWFAGFAPFQKPRYAFAVMVQGAKSGGAVSAPLAAEMLRRFESDPQAFAAKSLAPAEGNFNFLDQLPE